MIKVLSFFLSFFLSKKRNTFYFTYKTMREVHLFSRSFALNALERTSSHTPPRMTGDRERVSRTIIVVVLCSSVVV